MSRFLPRPNHCLNCGRAPLTGRFCSDCGQEATTYAVSLAALLREAFAEFVSWDGTFFRTLAPLLTRPGFLTNEFNAGRRVRYLSPFKMYLVVSALFFLVVARHSEADRSGVRVGGGMFTLSLGNNDSSSAATQTDPRNPNRDGWAKRFVRRAMLKARQSPGGLVPALMENLPRALFFLLPVYALLLAALYRRARRLYVEHLVCALHLHTWAFCVLSLNLLLGEQRALRLFLVAALFVYTFAALRAVYKEGAGKTLVKQVLLTLSYGVFLLMGLTGAVVMALALA